MRVGFIGYGNMASAVVRALLAREAVEPESVVVYNRTPSRLTDLTAAYPGVTIAPSLQEVDGCDMLVLGVRSGAVKEVMGLVAPTLKQSTHLVTFNGGVCISNLEKVFGGAISKVIPSMTIGTGRGVTLICHNSQVTAEQREALVTLFATVGLVREVREEQLEAASDLTSCAPGLMAEIMQKFAEGGMRAGHLLREEALEMVMETMMGTAMMLADQGLSPDELKSMVATKGGITEQGLIVLDRELPGTFDRVFAATLGKHEEVKRIIAAEFDQPR